MGGPNKNHKLVKPKYDVVISEAVGRFCKWRLLLRDGEIV